MRISQEIVYPKVSVVLPFFNAERWIREAIKSVIDQTFSDWELLLVNDGSTDQSPAIAEQYAIHHPSRFRCLEHPQRVNRGTAASRNLGLKSANGEFIALIDADDVWIPSKLAEQLCIMEAHPELGMVCGAALYWSSWEANRHNFVVPAGHLQDAVIFPPEATLAVYPLGTASSPCPSSLLMRCDLVTSIGGFEEQFVGPLQLYEDQAFLAKVYLAAPVYFAGQVWLKYRQHPDSCVASAKRDGHYSMVRLYFLKWFTQYVKSRPTDPRVTAALRQNFLRQQRQHLLRQVRRAVRRFVEMHSTAADRMGSTQA